MIAAPVKLAPTRFTGYRLHLFRCYAHSVADYVEVMADDHDQARSFAALDRGWPASRVIARYVKTVYGTARNV